MPRRFKTTEAHFEAFSQQQRLRFEDEMVAHLRGAYPDKADKMSEAWVRELIQEGIKNAKGYNIIVERDVARYIKFMIEISPDFDEKRWAHDILSANWIPASKKLDQIVGASADVDTHPATSSPSAIVGGAVGVPHGPPRADLDVTVVGGKSRKAISGARICACGPEFRDIVADALGAAHFRDMATGHYRVLVSAAGGVGGRADVRIGSDGAQVTVVCSAVT